MAHRIWTVTIKRHPLLSVPTIKILNVQVNRTLMERKNLQPFFTKPSVVFSKEALAHHWGAVPIVVITLVGFTLEVLSWIRIAVTRDDVWWTKHSGNCMFVETRKGYPAPNRKFLTFNQKYETPPGLIEALQGNTDGPSNEDEKADKGSGGGTSGKKIATHVILTGAALGVAAAGAVYSGAI
ncbi:uncharacterized protein ymp isoform X1 [Drosophila pseudoobscura]|uniref:Uncharacterized protein ymp isoform X1 n=1 Tax=Drosophila pseudoobscura pseudoobscura TaxID=46245 RepID=A0A6I8V616_DROPS|nr:uncharacterized protein LOC4802419 isoform X1 [Drosophila pseudoobscura]